MTIRRKLLILLLVVILVPLVLTSALHRLSTHRLGAELASGRREDLIREARRNLQQLVDGYGQILNRDKKLLELSLKLQAEAVERRLAEGRAKRRKLYLSEDYDQGVDLPEGMVFSAKHYRQGPDGRLEPIPVTYEEQVYFVVEGVADKAVAEDMARLSSMPEVYRYLYTRNPDLMYWQYTSLESGFHTSYPGHGGYPDDYDPRKRQWYLEAKEKGSLVWMGPMIEVSTRSIMPTLSMPIYRPDGSFAGVTAIDVPFEGIFKPLELPGQWAGAAKSMVVHLALTGEAAGKKLAVVAGEGYGERIADWQKAVELEYLESEDQAELEALKEHALSGGSGIRRMRYQGQDAFWAYGAGGPGQAFPLIIVPYNLVVARAAEAEQEVWNETIRGLTLSGFVMVGLVVGVIVTAFRASDKVSEPIRQITKAGRKLASGNYQVKVDVQTGDELQELGEVFNSTGPKLREREQMKQSLALAMEIQQNLLPQEAPKLEGFDIVGRSIYCDETGGDYYDFIELVELGPNRLGIAVGDVTGHGLGAALLMVSARGALRSHADCHGGDLGHIFDILNFHLVRDTGDQRFMTLFYGVLDGPSRSLQWTSGGHDPAIWLRYSTGEIEDLPSTGIPLGVLIGAKFKPAGPIKLESGDLVLIGTDGIWEARNPAGEQFGKDRLQQILRDKRGESAEGIRTAVVAAVRQFMGGRPQEDDITLVVIKAC